MVVPNREVVNINFFTNNSIIFQSIDFNIVSKDVNMDLLRDRSNLSSSNLSRKSLIKDLSFVLYIDRIEI